jgi:general secretion pathway protein D
MWIVVAIAAVLIVWRVGFYPAMPAATEKPVETEVVTEGDEWYEPDELQAPAEADKPVVASDVTEPAKSADVNAPKVGIDANEPARLADAGERRGPGRRPGQMEGGFDSRRSAEFAGFEGGPSPASRSGRITDVNDANQPMESLNLKNVEMKQIVQKIAEWTGKTVIPAEEAEKIRVSIYAPGQLPRSKALAHIYGALRLKGFVAEHLDDAIYITPIKGAKLGFVPTIADTQPLATLENKDQIVQKFFKMQSYRPTQMAQVIQPLVSEYGYVSADETTSTLLVIDTVQNLMRIERIVAEFDVPTAQQSETGIFIVQYGDPSEIVQMLNILLGQSQGYSSSRSRGGSDRGRFGGPFGGPPGFQQSSQPSGGSQQAKTDSSKSAGAATSVVVTSTRGTIILIPEPRRKWIIARASAEDMKLIDEWIKKLDKAEPVESEYEVVQLRYADASEVENSIQDGFRNLPGTEFLPSVVVEPLPASKQVLVFGRKDLREMVKKIIAEMDIPPGQFETQYFKLKYADPDQIKTNIDELYQEGTYGSSSSRSSYGEFYSPFASYGRRSSTTSSEMVKVLSYASLKQVTVIASAENMQKIREQIAEWDRPLDVNEVKPRIITLRNSDPVQLANLLNTLFSQTSSTSRVSIMDIMFGGSSMSQQRQKIVGPLYGQLTFEDVPGTKKIIVISKIPEAYDVVEQLVLDLDKEEMAQVPKVVPLKYADPEDLSERLNALFNEMGTTAAIRRSQQGLSAYSMESTNQTTTTSGGSSGGGSSTGGTGGTSTAEYRPPWTTGRTSTTEEPISNIIGKVRFVPDIHTKSLLVLAPPQFMANIEQMIHELDVPGKQVMIRAIVVEVDHSKVTSLGVELATNPTAFGTLEENSMLALGNLTNLGRFGSTNAIPASPITAGQKSSASVLGVSADVYGLIDFLIKKTRAKVLNQQTVWTKDNEEATFFKGDKVAFYTSSTTVAQGTAATQNFEFQRVGMTLRGRPSITPEKNVDMIVNVILSQLTGAEKNGQPVRSEMETTTNMIIKNGQTIMLGGILSEQDQTIQRKMPLLGDIPVIGGLFGHEETIAANNELIVFITPYVVDELDNMLPEAQQELKDNKSKLEGIQQELKKSLDPVKQERSEAPKTTPEGPNNSEKRVAEVYYGSIKAYRCGRFEEAREGFREIVNSDSAPQPMRNTAQNCLSEIDNRALYAKGDSSGFTAGD